MKRLVVALLPCLALSATGLGQQPISLINADQPLKGWRFGNGPEFPGARGELGAATEPFRDKPVLSLHGDFTEGGNYVQAMIALPKEPLDKISFWVNSPPGSERLPIRLTDAEEKVHQINLRLNDKGGWQHIVFPADDFFRNMGTPAAPDMVTGYEMWDGAQDRQRHGQPQHAVPNLAILASRAMGTTQGTILISDLLFHPSSDKRTVISKTIELDEMLRLGELDWEFNLGQEFKGAKGGLDVVRDQPETGMNAMRLHADFTGGGAYVGVRKSFANLNVQAMTVIRMKMRSETTRSFALRMVDATGQCHQRKGIQFESDGAWRDVDLVPEEIAGGEHWGGANDGVFHQPVRLIELMLNVRSHEGQKPDLTIADLRADVTVQADVKPAAFREAFDSDRSIDGRWETAGAVRVARPGYAQTQGAMVLQRTLDTLRTETWAASRPFPVRPGAWQLQYAWRADLHSPDNSYHGSVDLLVFDLANKLLETIPIGIGYGDQDWQVLSKPVELPSGATTAQFRIELRKTYGAFWLDDLAASLLTTQPIERRVERILLATDAVGNLFLPDDRVVYHVTVEAHKPLRAAEQVVRYSVRDYWGAAQATPGEVELRKASRKKDGRFVYLAEIELPKERLAVGKFYELHAEIPRENGDPVREFSGLAILPPAAAKQFAPEQVPFTIRNWDSRISVYFRLADRLGLRLMGVWGGWSSKPPYKPHCPGIDICKELDAKWVTGTPAARVEREGFAEYSEDALRKGMRNFLEEFADQGLAMIAMGNEPHGTGNKVLENVRAYKAVYETIKRFDPKIHVVGTSVEPNEEYFRAGYQKYLDSYDFHIYEHYTNVRRTIREYRELMEEYDAVKPIHSTELGLNSQGQTRHAVALEMIKKCTVFFAEGGATVSWFTIQYPDPNGKARGQFGDSHCVFDCKYNLYNPRLDAITYYNVINGICDKQFVAERHYANGSQAYLFRDTRGNCLQVLWLDDDRQDVLVPLPPDLQIEVVHLDGSRTQLRSAAGGVTLTLSEEPLLLLYRDRSADFAESLAPPGVSLVAEPGHVCVGESCEFSLAGSALTADSLRVISPPRWKTSLRASEPGRIDVTVHAPDSTSAREARIHMQVLDAGDVVGELTVPMRVGHGR